MSYVREKLYQATLCLVGNSDMNHRLRCAAEILMRIKPDIHKFKCNEFEERFTTMFDKLSAPCDDAPDGYIAANIKGMTDEQMDEIACEIVGMLWQDDLPDR